MKDNLGGSGGNNEGGWPLAVGGVLSSARFSADAGVKDGAANKDPTGLGTCCPFAR